MKNPLIEIKYRSGTSDFIRADLIDKLKPETREIIADKTTYKEVVNVPDIVAQINTLEKEAAYPEKTVVIKGFVTIKKQ